MNEHDDVMSQVRESFSGLRMDLPVEKVFARSRVRRRRQLSGLTTAAAATTAGVVAAVTVSLGGPGPARSGNPPPAPRVKLAAFSLTKGPGDSVKLTLLKDTRYARLDPNALRRALARHGIPALVTVGRFCRSASAGQANLGQVLPKSNLAYGSPMMIDGRAMPPGTRLSIGLFPQYTRMLLIKDGAHLSCGVSSGQPTVHLLPSGHRIR